MKYNLKQTYHSELSVCYHYYNGTSDPICNLYRELSEFLRTGCCSSADIVRKSCKYSQSRNAVLSVQTGYPGSHDLSDRTGI